MAKEYRWQVVFNGEEAEVVHTYGMWSGKHTITVNGEPVFLAKPSFFQAMGGYDQEIAPGIRFVAKGKRADLVVDGRYLSNGKLHIARAPLPKWSWIFMILTLAIPAVSLGGAVPFLIGFGGASFIAKAATSPTLQATSKVFISLGITLAAWVLFVVFAILIASM